MTRTGRRAVRTLAVAAGLAIAAEAVIAIRAWSFAVALLRVTHGPVVLEPLPPGAPALEPVSFRTGDGLLIRGSWVASRNGRTVVLTHGINGSRAQVWREALMLVRGGFGVLAFDFRGHGESEGEGLSTFGEREQGDLAAALDFLSGRGVGQVGALGFSMGGMVVANVAAADRRIGAVVLEGVSPSVEYEARFNARRRGSFSQVPAVLAHRFHGIHLERNRPVDRVCSLAPRPLLLIYGERETQPGWAPDAQLFAAACGPKELWIVPGAAHGEYAAVAAGELDRRLNAFFGAAFLATHREATPR